MVECVLAWVALLVLGCESVSPPRPLAEGTGETGIRFLGAREADGFARAMTPRELRFPEDHGAHPEFRTEWWYFTGNLRDSRQRHYGFEVTFFRVGLTTMSAARTSSWATNEIWMSHFAVTDTGNERFVAAERLARGALGLAGATGSPFHVWVKDWSVEGVADGLRADLRLRASDTSIAVDLALRTNRPPLLQGMGGLDAKGPEPGNASFYYSWPQLDVVGLLVTDGSRVEVTGQAWMDREWSTSALSDGIVGWDWFALQLEDGRSLMFYRLRDETGNAAPFSSGSLTDANGLRRSLDLGDVQLVPLEWWTSEVSGARYPVRWRLEVPEEALRLEVQPFLANQELNLSVRYWEGAVRAVGSSGGRPVRGEGYLELAGY